MDIQALIAYINQHLKPELFSDYCPNGLQIEGSRSIRRIACAVTASQYVIEAAIEDGADALLVHHGFFWKGESSVLTGTKRLRIKTLLDNNIHLIAYHLPLDAHSVLGNNAQLALKLGLETTMRYPDSADSLLFVGRSKTATTLGQLSETITQKLGRKPLLIGDAHKQLTSIAWCSGAAQNFFGKAIELGANAFITGEVSEQNYHQSNESGVGFIAAGHHATERFGVQALAKKLEQEFQMQSFFIDQDNPV